MDWTPILVAAIPTAGVVLSTRVAAREHALRKQLETTNLFLQLTRIASGRPGDARESVPIEEQIGAMAALTSLANRHSWLSLAVLAVFEELEERPVDDERQARVVQVARDHAHALTPWWRRPRNE